MAERKMRINQSFPSFSRWQKNHATEEEIRAYNSRMQPVWDAERAQEKAKANREELIRLAKETGVKVKKRVAFWAYCKDGCSTKRGKQYESLCR